MYGGARGEPVPLSSSLTHPHPTAMDAHPSPPERMHALADWGLISQRRSSRSDTTNTAAQSVIHASLRRSTAGPAETSPRGPKIRHIFPLIHCTDAIVRQ